jgi:hypothetical protein
MKDEIILKGRLDGKQRLRMEKLLDMLYMPGELAKEVGFYRRQVYRVYINLGLPHIRDHRDHIWINGKTFREWYEATYPRVKLVEGEGFCLTCKKSVLLENPETENWGGLVFWVGYCPKCRRKITRIIKNCKKAL